jgi:hypothetical protein
VRSDRGHRQARDRRVSQRRTFPREPRLRATLDRTARRQLLLNHPPLAGRAFRS